MQIIKRLGKSLILLLGLSLVSGVAVGASADEAEAIEVDDIKFAILQRLVDDPLIAADEVFVDVDDSVVTLTGSVNTLLAKEKVVKTARATKGVYSVVDRLKVEPVVRPDAEIRADVEAALSAYPATESYDIKTKVQDGVVTLAGQVDSWQEKQLAETVAKRVRGIKKIQNDIEFFFDETRSDSEIEAEIKRRLTNATWIDADRITVESKEGHVNLSGTVTSADEKTRAFAYGWVVGVRSVDASGLKVRSEAEGKLTQPIPREMHSDEQIEEAIREAFVYDPRLNFFNPIVEVNEGVAILKGDVTNLRAKQAAEEDAKNTVGVWRVKNFIKVRPEYEIDDAAIKENLIKALDRDVELERYEIFVSVSNGTAYLSGIVDSRLEKTHAMEVAAGVDGVVEVVNNLTVMGASSTSDWELKQDIISELFWNPHIDRNNISISVDHGTATLTGTVKTWRHREAAAREAYEAGATKVRNQLRVEIGPEKYLDKKS